MSDRSKSLKIAIDIDAKIKIVRARPHDRNNSIPVEIEVQLENLDSPPSFKLVESSDWNVIRTDGPGSTQEIYLKHLPPGIVRIHFKLKGPPGAHFSGDARRSIGILAGDHQCPTKAVNDTKQFVRRGFNASQTRVTLYDENNDGGVYRFALFVSDGARDTICDPRIINK